MNGRLDTHDRRLARVETGPTGGTQLEDIAEIDDTDGPPNQVENGSNNDGRTSSRRVRGDGGGDIYGRPNRYARYEGYGRGVGRGRDEEGRGHPPRPNFPSFDGESDLLTWNKTTASGCCQGRHQWQSAPTGTPSC
jgi:hypothetical protein